jgi:hypothetical protein
MFILANDQVEAFDNTFRDNNTTHVSIISYNTARILSGLEEPTDPNFDPFTESIYVLNNTYVGGGTMPDPDLADLVAIIGGLPVPHIFLDGDVDPDKRVDGELPDELRTCIQETDDPNRFIVFVGLSRDLTPYDCELPRLPIVAIPGVD